MSLRILHTNDFHGTLDDARVGNLLQLRTENTIYLDSGDCIRTGNLGIPLAPEPAWDRLSRAKCDASVLGNRESHVLEGALEKKIQGASHPILVANLFRKNGERVFPASCTFESAGIRIGVIGAMVPMVTATMKTAALSAYLWTSPIDAVVQEAVQLRKDVDLLIGLTHIGYRQDQVLAERCQDLDIILGGHSHTVLTQPTQGGRVSICQGGSHGRFVGVYEWNHENGLSGGLRPFDS